MLINMKNQAPHLYNVPTLSNINSDSILGCIQFDNAQICDCGHHVGFPIITKCFVNQILMCICFLISSDQT